MCATYSFYSAVIFIAQHRYSHKFNGSSSRNAACLSWPPSGVGRLAEFQFPHVPHPVLDCLSSWGEGGAGHCQSKMDYSPSTHLPAIQGVCVLLSVWGPKIPTRIVKQGKYSIVGTFPHVPRRTKAILSFGVRFRVRVWVKATG